jgi:hypothetical protein
MRSKKKDYYEAMHMCIRLGKPTLFVTFSCNPNWKEIKEMVPEYGSWEDIPDIVDRVFLLKLL